MKNIFKILLLSGTLTLFSGCSDFLERPVLGQENLDTYFQNEEECLKQVAGCYQGIFWDGWWQIQAPTVGFDMCTDDLWMGNTTQSQSDWIRMSHYGNSKTDGPLSNYWQYRYKGILRCNIVIEKVPEAPIKDEDLRKRMIAEAKFIRAYQYFELVKNFGGVPVVLGMLMPNELDGITRKSVEETYAQIEQDLKDAIADLPAKSEYAAKDLGRATRGAAMGYLGKVYLYQDKYSEAEKILGELIDTQEYDLCPDFKDVWSITNNNNVESLFEVQYSSDISYSLGGRLSVFTGSRDDDGWSWGQPTSNLEKAFLDAGDGERLKWTIIKHGDDVPGDDTEKAKNYVISPSKHKSARINRKFYIPHNLRPEPYDADHIDLNYRLLRFADVLLMYAEAANELGHDSEARKALKRVRDRVSLPEITSSGKTLRDAIRLERRLELALENQRLYDLRRWTDDNGKKALCNVMGPNGTFVKYNLYESTDEYETTNQKENSNKGITFQENRDLLFPIPNTEVLLSGGSITQNPNF
ncbi:RagB/SusD family nutrient uptake outer membrane protein [Dysgonomonas sp. Marseille-P4677]|uniref:RagB/SusD family nutrient uptake outer membrane protein n=1 Tax=Dysgonomonas sp. Marseille-P4677 TaxID=2364790 RepID=UPI001913CD4E|nr:RagB/SusD family nutrient uptake outer membrane protein [Dysgonomonas sp. Marseille-P4677]MBK5719344.1 RagB/SusD family nutrient uptake outer membrane protein [Dysgonomonas sp. Marseille-P4677]